MIDAGKFRYGLLLPHFGSEATRDRVVDTSIDIERYGFDSVWVRDHLVFHPHGHEDPDPTFVDPFVVLSAIAAVTENVTLATGALIPHRHPIHVALLVGSLDFIAGPGRLLIGRGIGTYEHEFDAAGMRGWDRREVLPEQVEIVRRLWRGESIDYAGRYYTFDDVSISPVPRTDVPIWYCGTSRASVRRAVEYCEGWIPGSMPRGEYRNRMERMSRMAESANRSLPNTGVIPWISPGRTREQAIAKLDVNGLVSAFSRRGYTTPDGATLSNLEDLDGGVIVGPPPDIVEEVRKYQSVGVEHFVFDLRLRFDDWEECIHTLGSDVLPELHRGDGR